jgi:hypothetical protein
VFRVVDIRVINDPRNCELISGNTMSPPELSTDAPILDVVKPVIPFLFSTAFFRKNNKLFVTDSICRSLGHIFAVNVPLRKQKRLQDIVTFAAST